MDVHSIATPDKIRKQKLVYGIGVNDADYAVSTKIAGRQRLCPFYQTWRNMLCRCYCPSRLEKRPSYGGCEVAKEWHLFSHFRNWMEKQPWEGWHLDKDFLTTSRVYSPTSCLFIPQWLNSFFWRDTNRNNSRPPGFTVDAGRYYKARLGAAGKHINIGCFATPEAAHAAYVAAKTDYVRSRYPERALIDPRLD